MVVLLRMPDRIGDDVSHVLVRQVVDHFTTLPPGVDEPCASQYPQVLRHQRLTHLERVDQLVHAARPVAQLDEDSETNR